MAAEGATAREQGEGRGARGGDAAALSAAVPGGPASPRKARDVLSSWQTQYPMPEEREEDPSKEFRALYK
jgi:hypothetical protein